MQKEREHEVKNLGPIDSSDGHQEPNSVGEDVAVHGCKMVLEITNVASAHTNQKTIWAVVRQCSWMSMTWAFLFRDRFLVRVG